MFKFFRVIRKRLISQNRFNKYLVYAIGEIVLVVIGILLALQINIWRQESANRKLELKILKEINRNLNNDLAEIRSDIMVMDSVRVSCETMLNNLKTNNPPNKSFYYNISKLKGAPHFEPNKSGYSFLQAKGMDLISNDSLREAISIHYELSNPYYRKYEDERIQFKVHQTNPDLLKYFTWHSDPALFFPSIFKISDEDYFKIKNDGTLERMIAAGAYENYLLQDRAIRLEIQIQELMHFIYQELEE